MRLVAGLLAVVALVGGAGCSASGDDSADGSEALAGQVVLSLRPLDLWARALPPGARLTVKSGGATLADHGGPLEVSLRRAGPVQIHLEAPQYEPVDLTLQFDGTTADGALTFGEQPPGSGRALGHVRGSSGVTHVLYLGLRHRWFSAEGRAPRTGNALSFLMDGEEAWTRVHADLKRSQRSVMLSTWWWQSEFELVRPAEIGAPGEDRRKDTLLALLEESPAQKRVLVGSFDGQDSKLAGMTVDDGLMAHAYDRGDGFEVMQEGNPTRGKFRFEVSAVDFVARVAGADPAAPRLEVSPKVPSRVPSRDVDLTQMPLHLADFLNLSSIHQKFVVVDDEVAFVGGMNLKQNDWDSSEHLVYDHRRENLGAFDLSRWAVFNKAGLPDNPPRKDYMVRIEGPAAEDVADIFHERWERLRSAAASTSGDTSRFDVSHDVAPRDGGLEVQLTATMPGPHEDHAIAETWFNAVANAEKFIYIEDQYFRAPMLNDAIAARMDQVPGLKLIVVTADVGILDPACAPTYATNKFFRQRYGSDRYLLTRLRSFDLETYKFVPIDTHSKLLIVDDLFMSVGSANMNNRGMVYEAELNVAIADPIVGEWRRRIAANLLPEGTDVSEPDTWYAALRTVATANDKAYAQYRAAAAQHGSDSGPLPPVAVPPPRGFVYPLGFDPPTRCLMKSVGPDET